jgi:integrase
MQTFLFNPSLQEWLTNVKRKTVSHKTFQGLTSVAKRYIYPRFDGWALSEITPVAIRIFIGGITQKGPAQLCRQVLNEFFNHCVNKSLLKEHPAATIVFADRNVSAQKFLDDAGQTRLLNAVSKNFFWNPLCLLILQTGIKLNELLALTWKDIDFEKTVVSVDKYVSTESNHQKQRYIEKYHTPLAIRKLKVSDEIIEALKKFRLSREVLQLRVRNRISFVAGEDLIFSNKHGQPFYYSGMVHVFRKYLNRKGLSDMTVTFSTLRNTFMNTILMEAREPCFDENRFDNAEECNKYTVETPKRKAKRKYEFEM